MAEAAQLAHTEPGFVTADGCHLYGSDPLALLAPAIARSMTEADLAVHHCAPHDPLYRLSGVCLLPVPVGPSAGRAEIAVSWTTHNLLLHGDTHGTHADTQQAMDMAIGGILRAFGHAAEPFGSGVACLVTGHGHQDPGAGR